MDFDSGSFRQGQALDPVLTLVPLGFASGALEYPQISYWFYSL